MADGDTTWIAETREAVDRASNVTRAQAQSEILRGIDEDLDRVLPDLAKLEQAAALGSGTWWTGVDAPPDLWKELRAGQRDLSSRQLAAALRELAHFTTRARAAVRTAWKNHVAAQAGDASQLRDLAQVLSGVEGLAGIARVLDEALGRLAKLQKDLPDVRALEVLTEAVELLQALESRLPAAVKAFVSAAARGGAPLELLDAEVRGWLVDNGALHNFRVVPGQPQEAPRG